MEGWMMGGGAIAAVLFGIAAGVSSESERLWPRVVFPVLTTLGVVAFAVGLTSGVVRLVAYEPRPEAMVWEVEGTTLLQSMAVGQETSGGGSLLYVSVTTEDTLRYLAKHEDGSVTLETMRADGAKIFEIPEGAEGDAAVPRIERWECHVDPELDPELPLTPWDCGSRTEVHVPAGSVSQDFAIEP